MRPLTPREKRTVRYGAIGIAVYLVLFCGVKAWAYVAHRKLEYDQLVHDAIKLKQDIQVYEAKAAVARKLMEEFRMDPLRLSRASVIAEASAAIQKAAAAEKLQVGPVRESPGRPSSKELGSVQMEGTGPVKSILTLLGRLESIGFPLIVDSVQITQDTSKPGNAKVQLTLTLLDFEQWAKEAPHA